MNYISNLRVSAFICGFIFVSGVLGAEVVVYTSVDEPVAAPILKEFERASGIKVVVRTDAEANKTVGLTERVRAEKDNPQCDVWWCNEPFHTVNLAAEGVLEAFESGEMKGILQRFKDSKGRWAGNGMRVRVLTYHEGLEEGLRPKSLMDLTKAGLKGKIAMCRPTIGTISGHIAALYLVWGETKADGYFRDLRANGMKMVGGNSVVAEMVGKGTLWAGMTDNDDCDSAREEGGKLVAVIPEETIFIPCTVGIVKGARNRGEAGKLADYLLSKGVEEKLIGAKYCKYSVRSENKVKTLEFDYNEAAGIMGKVTRRAVSILEGREGGE